MIFPRGNGRAWGKPGRISSHERPAVTPRHGGNVRRLSYGPILAASALLAASAAQAQADQAASTSQSLANADDAEASFRFAAQAAAAGDVVGAIAALERVLQTNPDLANIKLELGLLYLRAGNADLARSYLREAANAPDAPEAARQRARQALGTAAIASGGFSVAGSLFVGAQVQSNPNGSPGSVSITGPGGVPIIVSGDDLSIPRGTDISGSAGGYLQVRHGLNSQRGNDIVADFSLSRTEYDDTTELNATYAGARIGPRFFLGSANDPKGFVRPIVSATLLTLGGPRYFSAYGGGLEFLLRPALDSSITGQLTYDDRDYHNSRRRPTAEEQSGDYISGVLEYARQATPRLSVNISALFEGVSADRKYWSRATFGGQVGTIYAFASGSNRRSWIGRLNVTYRRSDYVAPDPLVDPLKARNEDRTEIEAALSIPLIRALNLELRASQTWNRSNLPNYDFNNTLGAIGLSYQF